MTCCQICLNVYGKPDQMTAFDELYDMEEQSILREECQALVGELLCIEHCIIISMIEKGTDLIDIYICFGSHNFFHTM